MVENNDNLGILFSRKVFDSKKFEKIRLSKIVKCGKVVLLRECRLDGYFVVPVYVAKFLPNLEVGQCAFTRKN